MIEAQKKGNHDIALTNSWSMSTETKYINNNWLISIIWSAIIPAEEFYQLMNNAEGVLTKRYAMKRGEFRKNLVLNFVNICILKSSWVKIVHWCNWEETCIFVGTNQNRKFEAK